jgi:hypothetical protein
LVINRNRRNIVIADTIWIMPIMQVSFFFPRFSIFADQAEARYP